MKARKLLARIGIGFSVLYIVGAYLIYSADYADFERSYVTEPRASIVAYYVQATKREALEMKVICPANSPQEDYERNCLHRRGYDLNFHGTDEGTLYKKKASIGYITTRVLLVPLVGLSFWLLFLKGVGALIGKVKGRHSDESLLKNLSKRYSSVNKKQRNILRFAALLSCVILGPVTLFLVTPWLLPLMLYLEYHSD